MQILGCRNQDQRSKWRDQTVNSSHRTPVKCGHDHPHFHSKREGPSQPRLGSRHARHLAVSGCQAEASDLWVETIVHTPIHLSAVSCPVSVQVYVRADRRVNHGCSVSTRPHRLGQRIFQCSSALPLSRNSFFLALPEPHSRLS